jgi:DedD protein
MGLFSSSRKNKQDRAAQDSGHFISKDEDAAIGERARAKRASNAGGTAARRQANDPLLPEKKRARRRLVGAIALALAAAVGLPMLLDSEPRPLAGDIAIQIPAKDKAAPLPVPGDKPVAVEDSVDKGEEVVTPAAATSASVSTKPAETAPAKVEAPAVAKVEAAKPEPKPESRPEPKPAAPKVAERKQEHKDAKPEHRLAEKPADKPAKPHDDARALAILEDKPAEKPAETAKPAESASQKFVLQVAALSSQEKAAEVQAKLREAGISSYTQKTSTSSGELIRVRVGPMGREEAEKVRAKLGKLGMSGTMTPV